MSYIHGLKIPGQFQGGQVEVLRDPYGAGGHGMGWTVQQRVGDSLYLLDWFEDRDDADRHANEQAKRRGARLLIEVEIEP
jgi:hypothetical protein